MTEKYLESIVRKALKEGGIDIPSGRLVEALVLLLKGQRNESAGMVEALMALYDELDSTKLELLAYAMRTWYQDPEGEIQMPEP